MLLLKFGDAQKHEDGAYRVNLGTNFETGGVKSVSVISARLNLKRKKSGVVRIYIHEFEEPWSQDYTAIKLARSAKTIIFEPHNPIHFGLRAGLLSSFTIEVKDSREKNLELGEGNYISVFVNVEIPMYHHVISVRGSYDNETSCIRVKLPRHLELEEVGIWKAGLTSICLPDPNYTNASDLWVDIFGERYPFSTNPAEFEQRFEFITSHTELQIQFKNERIIMYSHDRTLSFTISSRLAFLMGLILEHGKKDYTAEFSTGFVMARDRVDFSRKQDTTLIVKSNFSSPVIYNSELEPIFAMIPLVHKTNRKLHYFEPKNITYVNVKPSVLDEVEFYLFTMDGKEIVMPESTASNKLHVNFIVKHEI